jgi:Predicted Ser/Thr protein kinase
VFPCGKVVLEGGRRALGKGKSSVIYLASYKGKICALKLRRCDYNYGEMEGVFASIAGENNVGPEVYNYGRNYVIMQYLPGLLLGEVYLEDWIINDLIERARRLDEIGIDHKELSRPWKQVIIYGKRTYIIDYDSARFHEKPRNVNRIIAALKRKALY